MIPHLPSPGSQVAVRARAVSKRYPRPDRPHEGLLLFAGLDLEVARGEMVAIVGQSGTGKSSLLHLLAGLDQPTTGEIQLGDTLLADLSGPETARLRNREIGFVWQFHYLLPEFSALENVAMPLLARGSRKGEAEKAAGDWLARVGLADRQTHRSGELSGGEQQRVAIARALVTRPSVLLADEPTGDLDADTAGQLCALLELACRQEQLAIVLVTHDVEIARRCHRVLRLAEGRLEELTPAS